MPSEEQMSVDERRKYLKLVAPRYAKAGRRERSALLTEMAAVMGLHRKSLLRPEQQERLAALYASTNPRQLREEIYQAVEQLWQSPISPITTNQKAAALLR